LRTLWFQPFDIPPMLRTIVASASGFSFAAFAWT
jgi:hypothetical protein